jgi:hypothetical protein
MKTRRTRILIVVIAASVIVSIFMDWNDIARGAWEGWNSANSVRFEKSRQALRRLTTSTPFAE